MVRSVVSEGQRQPLPVPAPRRAAAHGGRARAPALRVAAALLGGGVVASCDPFGPRACPASIEPAVEVQVVDGATGLPAASGAAGVVREGAFVDSLQPGSGTGDGTLLTLIAAFGRAGTYRVEVARAGYAAWARDGVRARRGDCGIVTARVRAELVPATASPAARGAP